MCSIAEDNSVAILSTSQNKCLMLASCHTAPVKSVHWRLDEDFLLVNCTDGRLYVWQIETGNRDKCISFILYIEWSGNCPSTLIVSLLHVYRIAGYFRGENISWFDCFLTFVVKLFVDC